MLVTVLATIDYLPLLRPLFSRPPLPRLLPSTLREAPRGVLGPLSSALFLAPSLCNGLPDRSLAPSFHAFPRASFVVDARLHLVSEESRYAPQLPWTTRLLRPVPALGVDGIQSGHARHHP